MVRSVIPCYFGEL